MSIFQIQFPKNRKFKIKLILYSYLNTYQYKHIILLLNQIFVITFLQHHHHQFNLEIKQITVQLPQQKVKTKNKDYQDKHTTNLVLDNRTRLNIFNLQNQKKIPIVENLINSGKESSVFKAGDIAIKIFATSNTIFKNRQIYIQSDRRFTQINTTNSRQVAKIWCEKEYRNLNRIYEINIINCPKPISTSDNILIMSMLDGTIRLVDIIKYLSPQRIRKYYYSTLRVLRDLYQKCGLVHGDFSEYNILCELKTKKLYLIDVGQACDTQNETAIELLRTDIKNITIFFSKYIQVVNMMDVLKFVVEKQGNTEEINQDQNEYQIFDSYTNQVPITDQYEIKWLKLLKQKAQFCSYQEIQQNLQFMQSKIVQNVEEGQISFDLAKREKLQNNEQNKKQNTNEHQPGQHRQKYQIFLDQQNQQENLIEGNTEETQESETTVSYSSLDRNLYTKEQWKQIQQQLRLQKQNIRQNDKKPKKEKKKEKKKAAQKARK